MPRNYQHKTSIEIKLEFLQWHARTLFCVLHMVLDGFLPICMYAVGYFHKIFSFLILNTWANRFRADFSFCFHFKISIISEKRQQMKKPTVCAEFGLSLTGNRGQTKWDIIQDNVFRFIMLLEWGCFYIRNVDRNSNVRSKDMDSCWCKNTKKACIALQFCTKNFSSRIHDTTETQKRCENTD